MLDLNLVGLSTEVTSKELLLDEHIRRLQEVVDKEPYPDDQATCASAIMVGTSGHKTCKVGQANRWTKSWEISSYTLLLKLFLSSQSLSAKDHIVNIGLL